MSMARRCPNCLRTENIRFNFGDDNEGESYEAERKFHAEKWCKCGYNSPEEMMLDQDMGFTDPTWIPFVKFFLNNYYIQLPEEEFNSKEELVRFFLKSLKSSANSIRKSIVLVPQKEDEVYEYVNNGKPSHKVKSSIFNVK